MIVQETDRPAAPADIAFDLLRCPVNGETLQRHGDGLRTRSGLSVPVTESGIPLFAEHFCSADARVQQQHYDRIAQAYFENLGYPHTEAYMAYLDRALLDVVQAPIGTAAEVCCGRGEAFLLLGEHIDRGVGVDISLPMLEAARRLHGGRHLTFVQGDATMLPLADAGFDTVFMLGGIHHVGDRARLFREIARILKPGGRFYFREPVSDFALWRWIRWVIYRISPTLDHETETPLRHGETAPYLRAAGLDLVHWRTHGFLGFCFFMNSDVLVFNRLFRFVPGIRAITRASTRLDEAILRLPGFSRWGLQVVGIARKPLEGAP